MTRRVWVAWNGLAKGDINIWERGLVLEGHPAIERYPDALEELGTVGDDKASEIKMWGKSATLPVFGKDITPLGVTPAVIGEQISRVRGRPGRHSWTPELFHQRSREAWEATKAPRTWPRIADNFRGMNKPEDGTVGMDPDSLRRLVRRFGLPTDIRPE